MIVEDEYIIALDLKAIIESLGYNVCAVATSGEESIQLATKSRPDLVLMDIRLKGRMDGIRAAQIIKNTIDIPVIYLTAYNTASKEIQSRMPPGSLFIQKPFSSEELREVIDTALA